MSYIYLSPKKSVKFPCTICDREIGSYYYFALDSEGLINDILCSFCYKIYKKTDVYTKFVCKTRIQLEPSDSSCCWCSIL